MKIKVHPILSNQLKIFHMCRLSEKLTVCINLIASVNVVTFELFEACQLNIFVLFQFHCLFGYQVKFTFEDVHSEFSTLPSRINSPH